MANDEGRQQALKRYRLLTAMLGLLGASLLALGIAAVVITGSNSTGLPYFLGGFIVGIMNLGATAICTCILLKAPGADTFEKRLSVGCAIQGQYFLAAFTIMGCFIGSVFAGVGGISKGLSTYDYDDDDKDDEEELMKKRQLLATLILVGCILGLFATIFSMCTVCTYSSYFGVVMKRNRRGKMTLINTGQLPGETTTTSNQMSTIQITRSLPAPKMRNNRVDDLEKENRLLQQQLELQKQLNEQKQQQQMLQQTQYSDVYPPPPPSYDVVYPPPPN